jgi:NADH-quinone oxidoreductase subunit L
MGGEQDIRRMGGLKAHMKITWITFLIGTLAISGIFPFAGFFSKDQILAHAMEHNLPVFVLLMIASAGTAFYMFRMFYLTFHGKFRGTHEQEHHLHESPRTMTFPLIVLAVLSVVGGFIGFPHAIGETIGIHHWLDHFLERTMPLPFSEMELTGEVILALVAMGMAAAMIWYAWLIYVKRGTKALEDNAIHAPLHRAFFHKYWMDECYDSIIRKPMDHLSRWFGKFFEPRVIDGMVEGSGKLTRYAGQAARTLQSGYLSTYLYAFLIGVLLMLIWLI